MGTFGDMIHWFKGLLLKKSPCKKCWDSCRIYLTIPSGRGLPHLKTTKRHKLCCIILKCFGYASGVHQSHAALKQHADLLEAALARRESTTTELNEQLTAATQERAMEENKLQQLVKELEEGLQKEKAMSKDLRKQVSYHGLNMW